MGQTPQHKSSYTEPLRTVMGCTLEQMVTGDFFLNISQVGQTLRLKINKWELLKLKSMQGQGHRQDPTAQRMEKDVHQSYI